MTDDAFEHLNMTKMKVDYCSRSAKGNNFLATKINSVL